MKTTFTKAEILSRRGCYSREDVEKLSFIDNETITIQNILDSEIPLRDKGWFLINSGDAADNTPSYIIAVSPILSDACTIIDITYEDKLLSILKNFVK